jgi:hypothetical protein
VLTQPSIREEGIGAARGRFEKSWKAFYPLLRKCGLRAALATYHAKPSAKYGWHYHCHLVVEFDDVVDAESLYEKLNLKWTTLVALNDSHRAYNDLFMRMVTDAGGPLAGMKENTQLEFWSESQNAVETALHYVIRDVLQGIEGWVAALNADSEVFEFCDFMGAAKRHRTYGEWRKCVPADGTEERDASEDRAISEAVKEPQTKGKVGSEWSEMSTMDGALQQSKLGSSESANALRQLIGYTNRSKGVLFRLRKLVTWLAA